MNFIKLTAPGTSHTLIVRTVTVNAEGKWPDYNLSDGTDTVTIPQTAADRQLERLKVAAVTDLVGATVKVSRSEKPGANGKHFWNLDIVNAAAAKPAPSKRLPPPANVLPFDQTDEEAAFAAFSRSVDDARGAYRDDAAEASEEAGEAPATDEPALTPREVAARDAATSAAHRRAAFEASYLALYGRVLTGMCAAHARAGDESPHVSSDAVQAACATLVIQWGKAGLIP